MQTIVLRSLALLPLLLVSSCSFDRGFRFYGEYEAEQSRYRIQLISQGYVKPGDDLAESAFALVQFCPTEKSSGKAFRITLTAAPGQWNKIDHRWSGLAPRSLRLVARIFSANARLKKAPESYDHADSAGKPDSCT